MQKEFQISKARELETVLKISQAVSRTLDLDQILDMACRMTAQALESDRCSIGLLNDTEDLHEIVHTFRKKPSYPSIDGIRFKVSQYPHITQKVMHGKPVQLLNHHKTFLTKSERDLFRYLNLKAFLSVPIIVDGERLGAFHISRVEKSFPFSSSEMQLCQTIANQVGIAIKNARLLKELKENQQRLQKQLREQDILLDISTALSQTLDLRKLSEIVTKKTVELLGIDRSVVALFDEKNQKALLVTVYSEGKYRLEYKGLQPNLIDYPFLGKRVKKGKVFYTSDISRSPISSKEKKVFRKEGIKSYLLIPFSLAGKILGVFNLMTLKEQHNFTESEIKLIQAIANQLSVAIENGRLVQNLQEKSTKIQQQSESLEKQFDEQNVLLEISKALSRTLDLQELFEIITKRITELLGIDRCTVMLLDEIKRASTFCKVYSEGKYRPEYEGIERRMEEFPVLVNRLLKKEHIFCTTNVSRSALSSKEKRVFEKEGIKSLLVIPFSLGNKKLGLLALSSLQMEHQFSESEIKLSQAIASQISVAVENSQLMELTRNYSKELEKLSLQIINAQEEERKNIAGKLHDEIAQDLTAIQFDLKICQQAIPEQYAQTKVKLKECEELISQNMENLRNLTSDLRPPILDHFGLASALHWYVDNFRRRTNLQISLKIQKPACKFPPEIETVIYRIIQEGLANIAKHSRATRASISLYKNQDKLRIMIQDNGRGFDVGNLASLTGFGLYRLKENIELLRGKFKIISKRGRGTRLDLSLPCKEKN